MASEWPLPLYAYPSDRPNPISVTCATENALYVASNLFIRNPAKPFKSTTTGAVIVWTYSAPQALKALAAFNHNLQGLTAVLTNNNGLAPVSFVFPLNGGDNFCRNPWVRFDDQAAGVRTATVWTLTISGAPLNVAIGELHPLSEIRDFNMVWGLKIRPKHQTSRPGKTFGGTVLQYDKRMLVREVSGQVDLKEDELAIRKLQEEGKNGYVPWVFIEDEGANDAMFVQFEPDTFEYGPVNVGISSMPIRLVECSPGPSLY